MNARTASSARQTGGAGLLGDREKRLHASAALQAIRTRARLGDPLLRCLAGGADRRGLPTCGCVLRLRRGRCLAQRRQGLLEVRDALKQCCGRFVGPGGSLKRGGIHVRRDSRQTAFQRGDPVFQIQRSRIIGRTDGVLAGERHDAPRRHGRQGTGEQDHLHRDLQTTTVAGAVRGRGGLTTDQSWGDTGGSRDPSIRLQEPRIGLGSVPSRTHSSPMSRTLPRPFAKTTRTRRVRRCGMPGRHASRSRVPRRQL